MSFWILRILTTISIFQILLISFYLFSKKKGNVRNKLLITFLLIIWGIFIAGSFILLSPKLRLITYDTGHLMSLTVFLVAPLLYIYFSTLFQPEYKITWKNLLHALPFILIFGILFNEIVIQGRLYYVFYPTAIYLISLLFIQNIIYFFRILKKLQLVPENNGNVARLKLFRTLLAGTVILFFLKLLIFITWNVLKYTDICILITDIFFVAVFIIVNSLVIFSLNNADVIAGAFKYQNSPIAREELEGYLIKINNCLFDTKIFVDPLISLERLSKLLKIQERVLSQVINQESGLNFNDYINKYRINYAQQKIKESDSKKILEIAYECGFNSKTTFNTAFKKFTGQTPTEFRKISTSYHIN